MHSIHMNHTVIVIIIITTIIIQTSKKLLEPINEFSKVLGNEITRQISVTLFYANSELCEVELKKKKTYTYTSYKKSTNKFNKNWKP